jgi:hypothetical protein
MSSLLLPLHSIVLPKHILRLNPKRILKIYKIEAPYCIVQIIFNLHKLKGIVQPQKKGVKSGINR